jgi:uncharacterized protein YjbJ (UPF0337 family)
MSEARLKGSAKKPARKAKQSAGNVTGDQKLKREGVFDLIKRKVRVALGKGK